MIHKNISKRAIFAAENEIDQIVKDQEKSSEREEFVLKHIAEENCFQENFQQTMSSLTKDNIDQKSIDEDHIHSLELYEGIQ